MDARTVKHCISLVLVAMLVACGGPSKTTARQSSTAGASPGDTEASPAADSNAEYVVPVEFGRRPAGTPMASDNMPFFDTVTYCILSTRKKDTMVRGPVYEDCIEHQDHTRIVLGEMIDAAKFKEKDIDRCASASREAYIGMWYCLNEY